MGNKTRLTLTRMTEDCFGMSPPRSKPHCRPLSAPFVHTASPPRAGGCIQNAGPCGRIYRRGVRDRNHPPTSVELFYLCLARHALIRIAGLEFETYHPGPTAARKASHQMRDLFLNLFLHMDDLSSFGPLVHPRAHDDPINAIGA